MPKRIFLGKFEKLKILNFGSFCCYRHCYYKNTVNLKFLMQFIQNLCNVFKAVHFDVHCYFDVIYSRLTFETFFLD